MLEFRHCMPEALYVKKVLQGQNVAYSYDEVVCTLISRPKIVWVRCMRTFAKK